MERGEGQQCDETECAAHGLPFVESIGVLRLRLRPARHGNGLAELALDALLRKEVLDAGHEGIATALLVVRDQRLVPVEDSTQLGHRLFGDVHAQVAARERFPAERQEARGGLPFLLPAGIAAGLDGPQQPLFEFELAAREELLGDRLRDFGSRQDVAHRDVVVADDVSRPTRRCPCR